MQSVFEALHNLVSTRPGERLFNPEFGTALDTIIFEIIDDITSFEIYRLLIDAIERFEPRVTLDYGRSQVIPVPDEHLYDLLLVFSIRGFDEKQKFEFSGEIRR